MNYQTEQIKQIKKYYAVHSDKGLSEEQVDKHQKLYGGNRYHEEARPSLLQKIGKHLLEIINVILTLVALLAGYLSYIGNGNYTKSIVVLFIVIINITIAIYQESRAENALAALKKLSSPNSNVLRMGRLETIPSEALVCGDIILLTTGEQVGADIRLITSNSLQVDESSLTGESEPISKNAQIEINQKVPLGDQLNMVFSGT
ncbi:MAG: HAD-IC family P-type ATPase, partial [Streptococcaceae bacterium]|nr:HAD-IC family P-type ATPase [Streptococcaceae bacterium]